MQKHGTASQQVPGWYVEFQMAALRALPRDIDQKTADGCRENGEALAKAFREVLIPAKSESKAEPKSLSQILRLISGGHSLVLGACDGSKIIAKAKKTFLAYIDNDFVRWGADEPGQPTPETSVSVYEMAKDATFSKMFGSLSADVENLCFTQHQIISFVERYFNWLRTGGCGTFFLFKSNGHFFVASVDVYSGVRLRVYVGQFEDGRDWLAGARRRIVVPQLA